MRYATHSLLSISLLFVPLFFGAAAAEEGGRGGYVRLTPAQAEFARNQQLTRVEIAQSLTSDGFLTSVLRNVEYPIREVQDPATGEIQVYVWAGVEYYDPPLPGPAPAPLPMKRVYEDPKDCTEMCLEVEIVAGKLIVRRGNTYVDPDWLLKFKESKVAGLDFQVAFAGQIRKGVVQRQAEPYTSLPETLIVEVAVIDEDTGRTTEIKKYTVNRCGLERTYEE